MENAAENMLSFHHPPPHLCSLQPHQRLPWRQVRGPDLGVGVQV